MSRDRRLTESRLHEALNRLLEGNPRNVKVKGKLTLNKVNNEAKLGNSYVHKFPDFVTHAKPLIDEYNINRDKAMTTGLDIEIGAPLSEIDVIKSKLKKAESLKDKYRLDRDNELIARKLIEDKYSELLRITYDLQEELQSYKKVVIPFKT